MLKALYIGNKLLQWELLLAFVLWWSLSPLYWDGRNSNVWRGRGSDYPGYLGGNGGYVNNSNGVRPVISIKSDAIWSKGDGSPDSPYEIVYN